MSGLSCSAVSSNTSHLNFPLISWLPVTSMNVSDPKVRVSYRSFNTQTAGEEAEFLFQDEFKLYGFCFFFVGLSYEAKKKIRVTQMLHIGESPCTL